MIYSMNMPCYFQCGHLYREKWICSSRTHLKTVRQFFTFEICLHFNTWKNKQASAHSKNIQLIRNIYSHDFNFLWKTCLQLKKGLRGLRRLWNAWWRKRNGPFKFSGTINKWYSIMAQKDRLFITNTVKASRLTFSFFSSNIIQKDVSISQFMLHEHSKTLFHYDLSKLTSRLFTDPSREFDTLSIWVRTALTGYQVAFAKLW